MAELGTLGYPRCIPLSADEDGVIQSQVFPGLWLAVNDLLARDMGGSLCFSEGLTAPEHTAFVQQLSK
ncbi:hypothetical protein [Coleofasciculus sp. FACHB-SPT9]|uniref:hypothetical protein n=1 Tax=Coleofasciculus sp. FACHB-SPT9 TaxID=2692791 RepID=UPI001682B59F|nr:hypothetical protein [Coleofasciculus sp. FACHB-SPT9]MBD1890772.1 hypothetical protein [Coleofasciculus sp. FACHB-SPT9]